MEKKTTFKSYYVVWKPENWEEMENAKDEV